jgi:hypothetical protein
VDDDLWHAEQDGNQPEPDGVREEDRHNGERRGDDHVRHHHRELVSMNNQQRTAQRCFGQSNQPIDRITTREVVLGAGYNRTTFYKDDASCFAVLELLAATYREDSALRSVLFSEGGDPHSIRRLKEALSEPISKRLGVDQEDPKTAYLLEFGLSAIVGTLTLWYRNTMDIEANRLVLLLRQPLAHGMTSQFPIVPAARPRSRLLV